MRIFFILSRLYLLELSPELDKASLTKLRDQAKAKIMAAESPPTVTRGRNVNHHDVRCPEIRM